MIFLVCASGAAAFHSTEDFQLLHHASGAHGKIANACTGLAPGRFSSVSRDLKLRIWNGFESDTFATPNDHSIKCIAACASGRFVATGSYSGLVAIMDLKTRAWVKSLRVTTAGVSSLSFDNLTGAFLASSYDGRIYEVKVEEVEAVA